ncbi:MAG: GrpB family protein [Akkermansiaceae bacterium]|nr:GrpB family protein [Armatimonadota bacterium]
MDEIILLPYDPRYPSLFAAEVRLLQSISPPDLIVRMEHFGSTSVPGLVAKPIIDILIGVRSLDEARRHLIPAIETLGYSYWRDDPNPAKLYAVKGLPPNGPRTHHLHIVEPHSTIWEQLLFRDYLRTHPDEAAAYAVLKKSLAETFRNDREAYTDGKAEYISRIMMHARNDSRRNNAPI